MAAAESDLLERPEDFFPGVGVRPWSPGSARRRRDPSARRARVRDGDVPGHSPAHLAFASDGVIFSGDVLFEVGRPHQPSGADWDGSSARSGRSSSGSPRRSSPTPDTAADDARRRSPRIRFSATSAEQRAPSVSRRRGARRTSHPPSGQPGSESSTSARISSRATATAASRPRSSRTPALRAHGGRRLRRRPEGDVHVQRPGGEVADPPPGGRRADLPGVPRARDAPEPQPVKLYAVASMYRYAAPSGAGTASTGSSSVEAIGSRTLPSTPS